MAIVFDQLSGQTKVPYVGVELDLTGGAGGLPSLTKNVLHSGYVNGTYSGTLNTIYEVTSEQQSSDLFGPRSQPRQMAAKHFRIAPLAPLSQVGVTAPTGLANQGTVTLTVGATNPTASGSLTVTIAGRVFTVGFTTDDTTTTIAAAIAAEIGKDDALPATASSSLGVVTIEASVAGTIGDEIRFRSAISGTSDLAAADAANSQAGTLDGDFEPALLNAENDRYQLIVCPEVSATEWGLFETHIDDVSNATNQKPGMVIAGFTGTESDASTFADEDNYRSQVVFQEQCEWPCWELAAAFAAIRAKTVDHGVGLDDIEIPGLPPVFDTTKWNTTTELNAALNDGLTPIKSLRDGTCQIVRSINTRTTAPLFIDHNPIEIGDYCSADLIQQFTRWKGKKMKSASPANKPDTFTPAKAKQILHDRMRKWDALDYTQGVEDHISEGRTKTEPNDLDSDRMDIAAPLHVINRAHIIATLLTLTV